MKKNVFESCPKYLGALTWNHPARGKFIRGEGRGKKKFGESRLYCDTLENDIRQD